MFFRAMIAPATLALAAALFLFATVHASAGTAASTFFRAVDRDGNGLISLAEMAAHRDLRVAEVDINRDGFVTQGEFLGARSLPQDQINRDAWMQKRAALFVELDYNRDGVVSPAERHAAARQAFNRFDRDGNGGLSLAEIEQAR